MNSLSLRDRAIVLILVAVLFYAAAAVLWFTKFDRDWKKASRGYDAAVKTYRREAALIARRADLEARYAEEHDRIPLLDEDKPADTHWLERLSALAETHHVYVSGRKAGKEENEDVLNKLDIELDWDASLECLVKFLYALENADGAMFDVRSVGVAASGRNTGRLKGKMTVCCAYLRGAAEEKGSGR